ncbi:ATG17, partial [Candida africana]
MTNEINSATVTQDEVIKWSREAQSTLEKTQKICTDAQSLMQKTAQELTILIPDKLQAIEFLFKSYREQYDSILKQIETTKIYLHTNIDKVFNDIKDPLDPSLARLNNILLELKKTRVPSIVVEETSEGKTLFDFTSIQSINLLKENIGIFKSNCSKIKNLLDLEVKEKLNIEQDRMNSRWNKSVKMYDLIAPLQLELRALIHGASNESNSFMGTILRENQALENELVSILEMQTNHFDQCMKAVELISSGNGCDMNLGVLKNDAQELPEVFKELTTIYDIILRNEERSKKFLATHMPNIENISDIVKEELAVFRKFKTEEIPRYTFLIAECENKLKECSMPVKSDQSPSQVYTQTLQELTEHYVKFINIYKTKYLAELHHQQFTYPRKFLKKLTEFLNEDIYRIQIEESERRRQWISRYGEFIPSEFKLPGEHELPVIVQIITEGLEYIQKEDGQEEEPNIGNEKELMDMITGSNK